MDSQTSELVNCVWPSYKLHSWLGPEYKVSSWLPGKMVTTTDAEAAWKRRLFHVVSRSYQPELRTFTLSFRRANVFFTALKRNSHCSLEGKIKTQFSCGWYWEVKNITWVLKVGSEMFGGSNWRLNGGQGIERAWGTSRRGWTITDVTSFFFSPPCPKTDLSQVTVFSFLFVSYMAWLVSVQKVRVTPPPHLPLLECWIYSSWCYPLKLAGS